jgi:protein phosphatase
MRNAAAMLYCPNPTCQAPNSEDCKFCQKCATLLPKRYLWALGEGISAYQPGSMLAERYLCKQARIFLDTKPGLLSGTYQELAEAYLPYLRLVAYPLHIPQVYDWIPASPLGQEIVLLDHAPLGRFGQVDSATAQSAHPSAPLPSSAALETELLPSIASQWQQATGLRQLNWLWQMANLWQPLTSERAMVSLLDAENLRIDSTLIRLLELRFDAEPHSLTDLGQFWLMWADLAQPQVKDFMTQLCQSLINGQIYNAELLVSALDQAIAQVYQDLVRTEGVEKLGHQVRWATLSDQGPTRQRNEDACYPTSGTHASNQPTAPTLLIVCDGIGGHQGGDVASNLAIASLEQQVKELAIDQMDPVELTIALEKAVCIANDKISQQNDSERRFERQRMGTTVVMVLAHDHELYITHIGDSRVYWMTRWGCYQLTLDDDVASREVRLGYSFYRQALHQPSAGSLVQALGMSASSMLYPNVQRLIPDEPGILLLCSDGLSDNERVEEAWETDIRPLLEQAINLNDLDLANLSRQLVEIGNSRNGYDNVTVALLYYRPIQLGATAQLPVLAPNPAPSLPAPPAHSDTQATELVAPAPEPLPEPESLPAGRKLLPLMGLGIGAMGLAGLLAALLPVLRPASNVAPPTAAPTEAANLTSLEVGTLIELASAASPPALVARPQPALSPVLPAPSPTPASPALTAPPVVPSVSPGAPSPAIPSPAVTGPIVTGPIVTSPEAISPEVIGIISTGTVLEVLRKQNLSQQESWVELRVCSTASEAPAAPNPTSDVTTGPSGLQAGQTGWIREQEILPLAIPRPNLPTEQQRACS